MIESEEKAIIKINIIRAIGWGRSASMTGIKLAALVGSDSPGKDRSFRLLVMELIEEGRPIASTGSGYFMAETADEVKEYAKSLRDRAKMNFIRRRDFLRAARPILQPTQIEMALVT